MSPAPGPAASPAPPDMTFGFVAEEFLGLQGAGVERGSVMWKGGDKIYEAVELCMVLCLTSCV